MLNMLKSAYADADDYIDYDSDYSPKADTSRTGVPDVDPYAGMSRIASEVSTTILS